MPFTASQLDIGDRRFCLGYNFDNKNTLVQISWTKTTRKLDLITCIVEGTNKRLQTTTRMIVTYR